MFQPIADDGLPLGCENGFGMKLYAPDVVCLVAQCHDLAFFADGSHFQAVWQTVVAHHP